MKYIGEGIIITDDLMHLRKEIIVNVYQYENGDEIDSNGDIYNSESNEGQFKYRIFHGKHSYDCFEEEIELL